VEERKFLDATLGVTALAWREEALQGLAGLVVPDAIVGRKRALLRADINEQWGRWFVESLADPRRYAQGPASSYAHVFKDVYAAIESRFHDTPQEERQELASKAAKVVYSQVEFFRKRGRKREAISRSDKLGLLDLAAPRPACWICGDRFSDHAIGVFIGEEVGPSPTPPLVDILAPRGLVARDLSIDIDHIVAHAKGGDNDDNLALACGWCNRHKRDRGSIYEVASEPLLAAPNDLGLGSLPRAFWTVRHLALTQRCEHHSGCKATTRDTRLTVAPINSAGSMNPGNLRVTCYEHDPLADIRLQSPDRVTKLWSIAKGLRPDF